jgi:hypothetical protein
MFSNRRSRRHSHASSRGIDLGHGSIVGIGESGRPTGTRLDVSKLRETAAKVPGP